MFIYGLKNCDSCRKAQKTLPHAELVDIRATPLSAAKLDRFMAAFPETLLNRRSTTWRNLSEAEQNREPVALILEYPALMKRPVIDAGGKFYLGWTAEAKAALGVGGP